MTTPLKIEVGKFYKTRDGKKRRVICVDSPRKDLPIVALDELGFLSAYTARGIYLSSQSESCLDLISPWIEAPNPGEGWRLLGDDEQVLESDDLHAIGYAWVKHNHTGRSVAAVREVVKNSGFSDVAESIFFRRRIRPVVDWSAMPKWAQWVAMDEDGDWFWFVGKPRPGFHHWMPENTSSLQQVIPPAYSPTFTGSWKDSLVSREEAGR